jgi:hypothetical protein
MKGESKYDLSNKTILVYDRCSNVDVAIRLKREFGRVLYFAPTSSSYETFDIAVVGTGIPEIERIYDFWSILDEVDFFWFTDIYDGGVAEYLRKIGKLVFGSGYGEEMELDRIGLLEYLEKKGSPVGGYEVVKGLSNLREYLKGVTDKYIKIPKFRGEMETFHFENYDLAKPYLDAISHTMGLGQEDVEFIICDPINPAVEIGSDLFSINGKYASKGTWGIEIKDCGYVLTFMDYKDFPKQLIQTNNVLDPLLEEYNYCGPISTEVRVTKDGRGYLGDVTARQPQPPTSLQLEFYENIGEMAYGAAMGHVVQPVTKYKYGAQAIIYSDWAANEPQAIYFPEEIKNFVKIKNMCIRNGIYYYVPCNAVEMPQIGALVYPGATLDEAILEVKYMAKKVKGYDIQIKVEALDEATNQISQLKDYGITNF